ncbi:LOW QUALITY PROTEIN: hypothetical protein V2J09_022618 [Rumex salicifolius]
MIYLLHPSSSHLSHSSFLRLLSSSFLPSFVLGRPQSSFFHPSSSITTVACVSSLFLNLTATEEELLTNRIERWREYFRTTNADIFDTGASGRPKELKLRRDHLAEALFSSWLTRCTKCDEVELSAPISTRAEEGF